jgi:hypothetical protein
MWKQPKRIGSTEGGSRLLPLSLSSLISLSCVGGQQVVCATHIQPEPAAALLWNRLEKKIRSPNLSAPAPFIRPCCNPSQIRCSSASAVVCTSLSAFDVTTASIKPTPQRQPDSHLSLVSVSHHSTLDILILDSRSFALCDLGWRNRTTPTSLYTHSRPRAKGQYCYSQLFELPATIQLGILWLLRMECDGL